jgi:hypothetical protein
MKVDVANNIPLGFKAITPSDSDTIDPNYSEGIIATTTGGAAVINCKDGSADITITLTADVPFYADIKQVKLTGTAATGIHGIKLTDK